MNKFSLKIIKEIEKDCNLENLESIFFTTFFEKSLNFPYLKQSNIGYKLRFKKGHEYYRQIIKLPSFVGVKKIEITLKEIKEYYNSRGIEIIVAEEKSSKKILFT